MAPRPATTPNTAALQDELAIYTLNVARLMPNVTDFIVGNEPNLNTFWMPQFGRDGSDVAASAYEDLLARSYDAINDASPRSR